VTDAKYRDSDSDIKVLAYLQCDHSNVKVKWVVISSTIYQTETFCDLLTVDEPGNW